MVVIRISMDKNLKNALIVIAVIAVIYYVVSPYQNCMRKATWQEDEISKMNTCNIVSSW
jgi:hypothetical protein